MSETAEWNRFLTETERYYTRKVREHGATALGVDWSSEESQELRFEQLLRVAGHRTRFSINDFGCGYGGLLDFLESKSYAPSYVGFDISTEMIRRARDRHLNRHTFTSMRRELRPAEYTVASGIFNVKQDAPDDQWREFVLDVLDDLWRLSTRAMAFNVLTADSDLEHQRADLYYADPGFFLSHCRRRFSRWVALLQDYGLYEFTLIVRREGTGI